MADLRALLEMREASPLQFSDDGARLLVASNIPGTQQLYELPSCGGEVRQLTDYAEPVSGQLLPDGRILLERDEGGNERTQLYLLGDELEPLVVDARFIHTTPHLAPGSTLLVYATNRRNGSDFDIVARDLESGEERTFELGGYCAVESVSPDGRWIVVANEDGYSQLELRDPQTLELRERVLLPGRGVVDQPVFSKDGSLLAFSFSSPIEPHDVYLYDLDRQSLERLTTSPRDVGPATLVEPTLHRFESFDGESVPVFLFGPEGEGPFPVVVTVHGGPEAQWLPWFAPSFAPLTQHLVSHGYAVAAPNVRGPTGYGKRYAPLDDIEKRLDSVRDLASLHG